MSLTEIRLDKTDRTIVVHSHADVEAILEQNKTLRSMPQKSDWGRHIASIPNVICIKWLNEAWESGNIGLKYLSEEWDQIVARKLNDPEWAYLRTDAPEHRVGWGK